MITYQIITAARTILDAGVNLIEEEGFTQTDFIALSGVGPRALSRLAKDASEDPIDSEEAFLLGMISQQISTDIQNEVIDADDLLELGDISPEDVADIIHMAWGVEMSEDASMADIMEVWADNLEEDSTPFVNALNAVLKPETATA